MRFRYEGRDRRGKRRGVLSAGSQKDALAKLRAQGVRVQNIHEEQTTLLTRDVVIGNPVKFQQMIIFMRQFSTLLEAGVTVTDSLRILSSQTESKVLAKTLTLVEIDLREGTQLSAALAKFPKIFQPFTINMMRAGEASGSMDEALSRLAEHYEKQYQTRQKVKSALAYPLIVGGVSIAAVIFLLVFVVPTFVTMFEGFGGELPYITRVVLGASEWAQSFWYLLVLAGIFALIGFQLLRKNKQTKFYLDAIALRIPVFGVLVQKAQMARVTRTLSSLFSSSVPILQAMEIVEQVVDNEVVAKVIAESRVSLESGNSLTEPMRRHWAFPPLVYHMIAIGEETGSLDVMLGKVADFYEKEVELATDQIKSLIEPLMILFLAVIVGTIVSAIMVPMFEIFNNVEGY